MKSDLVLQDIGSDVELTCVTEHPGFQPVCLQKWSLRLAAGKYKTKGKKTYRQTDGEERCVLLLLRISVTYMFIRSHKPTSFSSSFVELLFPQLTSRVFVCSFFIALSALYIGVAPKDSQFQE